MKTLKHVFCLSAAVALLILAGCFNYEERIVLNKDGAGKMEVHYYGHKNVNINDDFGLLQEDEEGIRREVERKYTSKRVKLSHFKVKDKDSNRHVYFTVNFKNVEYLNDLELFEDNRIQWERQGRIVSFKRKLEIDGDTDWEKSDSFIEGMVKSIVEDAVLDKIEFRFELVMPGEIKESNADYQRGANRAVWRLRLSDVMGAKTVEMHAKSRR